MAVAVCAWEMEEGNGTGNIVCSTRTPASVRGSGPGLVFMFIDLGTSVGNLDIAPIGYRANF